MKTNRHYELADSKKLENFVHDKGLKAYTYVSVSQFRLDLDIVIQESLAFSEFEERKKDIEAWGLNLPLIDLDDLIGMKINANRSKDKFNWLHSAIEFVRELEKNKKKK